MKKSKILSLFILLSFLAMLLCSCSPYGYFITIGWTQPEDSFGKYSCQYNGNEYYIDENAVYENGQMLFEGKYMVYIATDGNYLCVSTFSPEAPEDGVMIYDLNKRMLLSESQILPDGPYSSFVVHDGKIFYTQGKTLRYFDIKKMEAGKPAYENNELPDYKFVPCPLFLEDDYEDYEDFFYMYSLISNATGSDSLYEGGSNVMLTGLEDDIVQIDEKPDCYKITHKDGVSFEIPKQGDDVFSYSAINKRDASSVYLIAQKHDGGEDRRLFNMSFKYHLSDYAYTLDLDTQELKMIYESGKDERIVRATDDEIITLSKDEVFRIKNGEKTSLGTYDAKGEKELYIEISGNGLYIFGENEEEFTHHLISRIELS